MSHTVRRVVLVVAMALAMVIGPSVAAFANPIIEVKKCPTGYEGVVVVVDGHTVLVCQNILP